MLQYNAPRQDRRRTYGRSGSNWTPPQDPEGNANRYSYNETFADARSRRAAGSAFLRSVPMGLLHKLRLEAGLTKPTVSRKRSARAQHSFALALTQLRQVCVLVLGLDGAGKSSVCECLETHRRARATRPLSDRRPAGCMAHVVRVRAKHGSGGKLLALDFSREGSGSASAAPASPVASTAPRPLALGNPDRYFPFAQAVLYVLDVTCPPQRLQQAQDEVDRRATPPL